MTVLLIAGVIVAIGLVLWHELGVVERTVRASDLLAERQRRARMESEK